jgi:hypothetical protein
MKQLLITLFILLNCACSAGKEIMPASTDISKEETKDVVTVKLPESVKEVAVTGIKKDTNMVKEVNTIETQLTEIFNHTAWDLLLKDYVSETGVVNYEGFRVNKGLLRDYIASLGANMPDGSWTKEDKLAYWMNAYNAMTVDLIVRNLPLQSIKDIDKPWNQRLWRLGSKWYNLDEIEHQILRKMGDARIHFGINCASFSCPPLLNEAFTAKKVNDQLDLLARNFINDPKRNIISEDRLQLSKIFSWFSKDFKTNGTLIDFLSKYSEKTINPKVRKTYLDYDWSLNN